MRVKDRIANPAAGQWRDVMVNFCVAADERKHVVEMQITHSSLLMARKGLPGHQVYARVRNASELLERLGLPLPLRLEALREKRDAAASKAGQAATTTTATATAGSGVVKVAVELLRLGCTPLQLGEAGYTLAELEAAGLPALDLVGVVTPADVVISYDRHDDALLMRQLRDGLLGAGIGAWADEEKSPGSNRMGPAISYCSMLITLISCVSVAEVGGGCG